MLRLFDQRINLSFIVNPFYLYCIAFSFALIAYLAEWSNIFPKLSAGLLLFFAVTFVIFIFAGYLFVKKQPDFYNHQAFGRHLNDIIFWLIILLGVINVLYMGYLPVLDRSHNYREFGMPVIDPLFNSLSIFFSVFFFHSFLDTRKKRLLIYLIIILIFQAIIFRRSAMMWIIIFIISFYSLSKKDQTAGNNLEYNLYSCAILLFWFIWEFQEQSDQIICY